MSSNRRRFIVGASAVAGASIAGFPAIATGQQPAKWRMQTLWSAAEITHKAFEDLCTRVGKATNERDRRAGMNVRSETGAVTLGFRVIVSGEEPPFYVIVEPIAQQHRANYSGPYTYLPDDPAMPGWINGKVDSLQLDVHHRLATWIKPAAVATK